MEIKREVTAENIFYAAEQLETAFDNYGLTMGYLALNPKLEDVVLPRELAIKTLLLLDDLEKHARAK